MKTIKILVLTVVVGGLVLSVSGCTYNKHYTGTEKIIDDGVVIREHYVVE